MVNLLRRMEAAYLDLASSYSLYFFCFSAIWFFLFSFSGTILLNACLSISFVPLLTFLIFLSFYSELLVYIPVLLVYILGFIVSVRFGVP